MRHTFFLIAPLLCLSGCGGGPPATADRAAPTPATRAAPAGPRAGDRVVFGTLGAAYEDAASARESRRLSEAAGADRGQGKAPDLGEAGRALDRRRVGDVWFGDLVEVVEVGDDYALIQVVKTREGDPGKVHGYVYRWW